jgi:hypothetical protein
VQRQHLIDLSGVEVAGQRVAVGDWLRGREGDLSPSRQLVAAVTRRGWNPSCSA